MEKTEKLPKPLTLTFITTSYLNRNRSFYSKKALKTNIALI